MLERVRQFIEFGFESDRLCFGVFCRLGGERFL